MLGGIHVFKNIAIVLVKNVASINLIITENKNEIMAINQETLEGSNFGSHIKIRCCIFQ